MAALFFFREYSRGGDESVLAYSLSMTAIATVGSLAMGLLFLRRGAALGLTMASEEVPAEAGEGGRDDQERQGDRELGALEPLPVPQATPRAGAAS